MNLSTFSDLRFGARKNRRRFHILGGYLHPLFRRPLQVPHSLIRYSENRQCFFISFSCSQIPSKFRRIAPESVILRTTRRQAIYHDNLIAFINRKKQKFSKRARFIPLEIKCLVSILDVKNVWGFGMTPVCFRERSNLLPRIF